MVVEVYGDISSAPTRLVLMTCECLELDYNFNTVSLLNGEHKLPEYTKVKVLKIEYTKIECLILTNEVSCLCTKD